VRVKRKQHKGELSLHEASGKMKNPGGGAPSGRRRVGTKLKRHFAALRKKRLNAVAPGRRVMGGYSLGRGGKKKPKGRRINGNGTLTGYTRNRFNRYEYGKRGAH